MVEEEIPEELDQNPDPEENPIERETQNPTQVMMKLTMATVRVLDLWRLLASWRRGRG